MTPTCPSPEQLAAFASGDPLDPDLAAHVATCLPCRASVADQRSIGELARRTLPTPTLSRAHRDRIAAEVMAQSDLLPTPSPSPRSPQSPRSRRTPTLATTAMAAAAALVIGIGIAALASGSFGHRTPDSPSVARTPDNRTPDNPSVARTPDNRTPDNRTPDKPTRTSGAGRTDIARVEGSGGQLSHEAGQTSDRVQLDDGALTIDARGTRPVEIATPGARVRIGDAKVAVTAKQGVIETVTVIAGTVEVTTRGQKQVVETGTIWERDHAVDAAFEAFRDGWTLLRANRYAEAIAAFDRANDPAVAEDARYWAAVASERAGQGADAKQRFDEFLARFPTSPRADAARAALARLTP